ncbi:NUDIX hydrolase [Allorhodopirellula solitaria]|uniref:8-oxo-dGTP diphosphatase n=1 Tax=Allorhodopirellula solitaria TaxID=2527987 RepID=A0A5C5YJ58_9BACT|nr:CoA pyrophosphatase [Allorhodopirellula solitaria]TWT74897.1 8-oxo-dGTP diphosphatase [Allorhodopirellula solitaria]
MARRLSARLSQLQTSPSQQPLQWNMTPQLAYGRHRGPARMKSRQAAVAVGIYEDPEQGWIVPLTRRPHALRHHGGQICFPGGRIEPGETPVQAALREFEEELGIPADVIEICGELPRQFVYASDNLVTPVVCVLRKPTVPWRPDPGEVDEVIHLPFQVPCQQAPVNSIWHQRAVQAAAEPQTDVAQFRFRAPAFIYQSMRIWGATAVILDQLAQCLLPVPASSSERTNLPSWPIRCFDTAEATGIRTPSR